MTKEEFILIPWHLQTDEYKTESLKRQAEFIKILESPKYVNDVDAQVILRIMKTGKIDPPVKE